MKKFTKIVLIVAAIFLAIGIACIALAFALGYKRQDINSIVQNGKVNSWLSNKMDENQEKPQSNVDQITETCHKLDVEFGGGVLEIKYADVDAIEVSMLDVDDYKCYVREGELHVQGGLRKGIENTEGRIMITIPNGYQFDEAELEVGAGKATVTGLLVRELDIEVGAGAMELQLPGSETDYNYELECGVGEIHVGSEKYSGIGFEKETRNPGAMKTFDVHVGAGEVKVIF